MTAKSKLLTTPPHAVEQSLRRLGADLKTARLRRNLTLADVAHKIGTSIRTIADAEKGNPSTSIAVYAAILWTVDLLVQLEEVARPERDDEGQQLALARERSRARSKSGLSNDF